MLGTVIVLAIIATSGLYLRISSLAISKGTMQLGILCCSSAHRNKQYWMIRNNCICSLNKKREARKAQPGFFRVVYGKPSVLYPIILVLVYNLLNNFADLQLSYPHFLHPLWLLVFGRVSLLADILFFTRCYLYVDFPLLMGKKTEHHPLSPNVSYVLFFALLLRKYIFGTFVLSASLSIPFVVTEKGLELETIQCLFQEPLYKFSKKNIRETKESLRKRLFGSRFKSQVK
eukprot:jgi/Galph1/2148/GphlegSOOS_G822.1